MGISRYPANERLKGLRRPLGVPKRTRRILKRQLARWNRRQGNKYLEDAPKKNRYRGWYW